jgi:hypothetical protein
MPASAGEVEELDRRTTLIYRSSAHRRRQMFDRDQTPISGTRLRSSRSLCGHVSFQVMPSLLTATP